MCLLFMIGLLSAHAQAQRNVKPLSNLRKKNIPVKQGKIQLDTLSIIPKTVKIPGVPDSLYEVDYVNAQFTWKQQLPLDSVIITYRVFSNRLNAAVNHMR